MVLGQRLYSMMLKIASSLNESMILWKEVTTITLGVPEQIKTDNGPAYTASKWFKEFLNLWGGQT